MLLVENAHTFKGASTDKEGLPFLFLPPRLESFSSLLEPLPSDGGPPPPASANSSALRWSSLARPLARRRFISSRAFLRADAVVWRLGKRPLGSLSSCSYSSSSLSLLSANANTLSHAGALSSNEKDFYYRLSSYPTKSMEQDWCMSTTAETSGRQHTFTFVLLCIII
jgi:hypothetical protein